MPDQLVSGAALATKNKNVQAIVGPKLNLSREATNQTRLSPAYNRKPLQESKPKGVEQAKQGSTFNFTFTTTQPPELKHQTKDLKS